MSGIDFKER